MAFGDIYQLIDVQSFFNQQVVNVWFYKQNNVLSPSDTAQELGDRWIAEVLPSLRAAQSNGLTHVRLDVNNLFNPSDTNTRSHSLAGTVAAAENTTPFEAIGIKLNHDNGAIRPGSKRIAGIDEGQVTSGTLVAGTQLTAFNTLAALLDNTLTDGALNTWLPVIVKRVLVAGAYSLPTTPAEAVVGAIVSAVVNVVETSQVSRKIGRGA